MHWRLNDVVGPLMLVFPVWPVIAVVSAVLLYLRHRHRTTPERRVPLAVYVVAVVICGAVAAFVGMLWGAQWECAQPDGGNLCGLVGVLVTGPMAGTAAVVLVGLVLSLIRPESPGS